jgi:hypothetical protein
MNRSLRLIGLLGRLNSLLYAGERQAGVERFFNNP